MAPVDSGVTDTLRIQRTAIDHDLDWIVMKCLEKDRSRRYDTANGLALDISRHLNHEPVEACPPSLAYRVRKAWQRNKTVCSAIAAVFLALATGVTIAGLGWLEARQQYYEAVLAREQSQANETKANEARRNAEFARQQTRQQVYVAETTLAFTALEEGNLRRARDLLRQQVPTPGEDDLRGFEWRMLWRECQSNERDTLRDQQSKDMGAEDVAFSPDGQWLAYGNEKIVICSWPSRAVVEEIQCPAHTLAFSPDSKLLASGNDKEVKLWSTESWQQVRQLPNSHYPAVFSPDGRWLVTGVAGAEDVEGGYLVWNTATWEPPRFGPGGPRYYYQSQHAVAFSPDGKLLVTAGHPGGHDVAQFQVWDFPSLTTRSNFSPIPFKLVSAQFTLDGKQLLTGDDGGRLLIWDVADGRVVESLIQHTGAIMCIAHAPDGKTFATGSADRTLIVWDARTRDVLARLRGHLEELRPVVFSPDGRMLASGSADGTTKLWDATTRRDRPTLPGCGLMGGFSADGRMLVAESWTDVRLWQLPEGPVTKVPLEDFSFRGRATWLDVFGLEPRAVVGQADGTLELWDLAAMAQVTSWQAHAGEIRTASVSPDARFVATSDEHGEMRLWELATHREVRQFEPAEPLVCLIFSPDGQWLAGGSSGSNVVVWEVRSGRQQLVLHQTDPEASVAFAPDGRLLAAAMNHGTVGLFDIPSGKTTATLRGHIQSVRGVAFSPDGKTLATAGDDRKVKLWNVATHQDVATLEGLMGGCRSVRFSPDGRTLAAGQILGKELEIWLWQAPTFHEIEAAEASQKAEHK